MRTSVAMGAVAAVVVVAGGATAHVIRDRDQRAQDRAARAVIERFAAGWQAGDVSGVPFAGADDIQVDFDRATEGLRAERVAVSAKDVRRTGTTSAGDLTVTWTLPGDVRWTYDVPVSAARDGERWVVADPARGSRWHVDLNPGDALTATRLEAARGDLLDREGVALMPLGTVYPVQLDPARATPQAAAALERIVEADPGSLVARLAAANQSGSRAPIAVITYREIDFAERQEALDALPGVIYPRTEQPLAPSREFGQPLLGSYGEVTAQIVETSDGRYAAGDRAGVSGLQRSHDAVLAGTPGVKVTTTTGKILFEQAAIAGRDVRLGLDADVQQAAERALAAAGDVPSALVALDVPSGQVLAVANRPSYGFDRALTGRFPPGSTFKIVSAYAVLSQGEARLEEPLSCPVRQVVDGKAFRNFEGETLGSPTFADDITHSCNTAFVQLAQRLGPGDLAAAARTLGIGAGWGATFGVPEVFDGSVPENTGPVDQAAAMIGQGRDLVSPLAVAVMTASVARGAYVPPVLVTDPAVDGAPDTTPRPLDGPTAAGLQGALRTVVTSGTGTGLRDVAGGAVAGKTGTAEFGTESPPQTHAWFTGWQGEVAFAVLVEQGRSGGAVAAPVARAFLTDLAARR